MRTRCVVVDEDAVDGDGHGQKLEARARRSSTGREMGEIIDFDHCRRARRMQGILLTRFGIAHFLRTDEARPFPPRLDEARIDDAVSLAMEWIARRSGRAPSSSVRARMMSSLRRELVTRIAESMVRAGL